MALIENWETQYSINSHSFPHPISVTLFDQLLNGIDRKLSIIGKYWDRVFGLGQKNWVLGEKVGLGRKSWAWAKKLGLGD